MRLTEKLLAIFTLFLLNSCMEYTIDDPYEPVLGVPNPPELGVERKTDTIVQTKKQKVDVLWIIDNSCSMSEEQSSLVSNFQYFINYFVDSDLDWHIGVTSTDLDSNIAPGTNGVLNEINQVKFIDENTPNPVDIFSQMATMGIRGSGVEQGLGATFAAISEHGNSDYNRGFYRTYFSRIC